MRKTFLASLFFALLAAAHGAGAIQVPQSSLAEFNTSISDEDEVAAMNHLLENTSHQMEVQRQMRQLMLDFRRQKEEFVQGNQTKSHAAQMVRTARQIYESVTAHHLQYLFSQEYLEELLFFSSIAGKNRVKSP
jgi:predicted ABC-type ATPase